MLSPTLVAQHLPPSSDAVAIGAVAPTADPSVVESARPLALSIAGLGKCYRLYDRPADRLKQMLFLGQRRYHREFWALRDVSFEVHRGEKIGIVGRNGSGKSTLLQLICGTLRPTTGRIDIFGRVAALLELGAGFNAEFTGRENVYINAAILGLSREQTDERFDRIVEFAELADFIDQPVKTYSSGMYVRLAFATAISVDPDILVVDEALAVGDEAFQRKCYARIEQIHRGGGTILFVSHSAGTVISLCDRAIMLDHGKVVLSGKPKAVVSRYQKLLFAPPEKWAELLADFGREGAGDVDSGAGDAGSMAEPTISKDPPASDASDFDPQLRSSMSIEYDADGATIADVRVQTPAGRRVNLLSAGESYDIAYRVTFSRPTPGARFGTLIRTVQGFELAGMAFPQELAPFAAGALVDVRLRFRCLLMPGTYFINAGVYGMQGDKRTFLHRIVDAAMIRVLPVPDRVNTGHADLFTGGATDAAGREAAHSAGGTP